MSYGSNHPARFERARWQTRNLRMQLVRQVGCVFGRWYTNEWQPAQHSCFRDAVDLVSDREWMAGEWQRRVRIPRSLRAANEGLGK
jgi:hypothetical protein